jgi:hypothetical protein
MWQGKRSHINMAEVITGETKMNKKRGNETSPENQQNFFFVFSLKLENGMILADAPRIDDG